MLSAWISLQRCPWHEREEVTASLPNPADTIPLMAVSLFCSCIWGLGSGQNPSWEASGTSHCKYLTTKRRESRAKRLQRDPPAPSIRTVQEETEQLPLCPWRGRGVIQGKSANSAQTCLWKTCHLKEQNGFPERRLM